MRPSNNVICDLQSVTNSSQSNDAHAVWREPPTQAMNENLDCGIGGRLSYTEPLCDRTFAQDTWGRNGKHFEQCPLSWGQVDAVGADCHGWVTRSHQEGAHA